MITDPKVRSIIYVVLAIILSALVVLGAIDVDALSKAAQEAVGIADAVGKVLAVLALVLAKANVPK